MADTGLGHALSETIADLSRLAKLEAALASRKLKVSARAAGIGSVMVAGGLVFALFGLLLLLVTAALALAIVLPLWASFLIVGGGVVVVAGVLMMAAVAFFRRASERASGATEQLKEDLAWVRAKTS